MLKNTSFALHVWVQFYTINSGLIGAKLVENYARYTIVILQKQAMGFTENLSFLSILLVICFHKLLCNL